MPIYITKDWELPTNPMADVKEYDRIFYKKIIFRITFIQANEGISFNAFILMKDNIIAILPEDSNKLKYYKIRKNKYDMIHKLIENNIDLLRRYPYFPEKSCAGGSAIYIRYQNEYFDICEFKYERDIKIQKFFYDLEKLIKKEILPNYLPRHE